jgi:ubiquinone/menaquinone biosynthesis C-methylase UbiE
MSSDYEEWDQIYRKYPLKSLVWELGRPRPILVEFVEKGLIKKGKALDICCGAGANTVYLAEKGFEVTRIDISSRPLNTQRKKRSRQMSR